MGAYSIKLDMNLILDIQKSVDVCRMQHVASFGTRPALSLHKAECGHLAPFKEEAFIANALRDFAYVEEE